MNYRDKDLIVFDLDGTLAPSKSVMDNEMGRLFAALLAKKKVAVIGGGKYSLFRMQLVRPLGKLLSPKERKELFKNLFLFPTTSTAFYRYNGGWKNVYTKNLTKDEVVSIRRAFKEAFQEAKYEHPKKTYGQLIENRGTQVSFSVFGQDVVAVLGKKGVRMKEEWKEKYTPVKLKLAKLVQKRLPKLEVRAAGYTTIDVTRKGIDKAYGIRQIEKILSVPIRKMVFIGDALYPGGNDYAARKSGVKCIPITGPHETKEIIREIVAA